MLMPSVLGHFLSIQVLFVACVAFWAFSCVRGWPLPGKRTIIKTTATLLFRIVRILCLVSKIVGNYYFGSVVQCGSMSTRLQSIHQQSTRLQSNRLLVNFVKSSTNQLVYSYKLVYRQRTTSLPNIIEQMLVNESLITLIWPRSSCSSGPDSPPQALGH